MVQPLLARITSQNSLPSRSSKTFWTIVAKLGEKYIPAIKCILFSVILHAIFSLEKELHPFEKWCSSGWRGFTQQYLHGVFQVHTHYAVATRGVRATLAVATVSQTICNGKRMMLLIWTWVNHTGLKIYFLLQCLRWDLNLDQFPGILSKWIVPK